MNLQVNFDALPASIARLFTDWNLRDDAIRQLGCIACRIQGLGYCPCEKHHLNKGDQPGRERRGERATVGLCQWHHVGRCWCNGFPVTRACRTCYDTRGPSWVHHKRIFLDRYGSGDVLLAVQDRHLILQAQGLIL